jgi:hypothetical protein
MTVTIYNIWLRRTIKTDKFVPNFFEDLWYKMLEDNPCFDPEEHDLASADIIWMIEEKRKWEVEANGATTKEAFYTILRDLWRAGGNFEDVNSSLRSYEVFENISLDFSEDMVNFYSEAQEGCRL